MDWHWHWLSYLGVALVGVSQTTQQLFVDLPELLLVALVAGCCGCILSTLFLCFLFVFFVQVDIVLPANTTSFTVSLEPKSIRTLELHFGQEEEEE